MTNVLLQLFLLLDIFLMGILTTLAVQQLRAHMAHKKGEPKKTLRPTDDGHLPGAMRDRMLHDAELHFGAALNRTSSELQRELTGTSEQLNKLLEKLGNEIVDNEMERYRSQLEQLRTQNQTAMQGAQAEIAEHQQALNAELAEQRRQLEAKLSEEITAEKDRLLHQLDTKLGDAVASFLLETLQHNVDLGAQSAYLTAMLEEHKAELQKGLSDGA